MRNLAAFFDHGMRSIKSAPEGWAHVISPRSGKIIVTHRVGDSRLEWFQENGYIIW